MLKSTDGGDTQARTDATADQVRLVVQRMIDIHRRGAFGPTAVITNNDVVFGMASMLAILSELGGGPKVQVFRTFNEGLDWLVRMKRQEDADVFFEG